jgi:hypothetical protein
MKKLDITVAFVDSAFVEGDGFMDPCIRGVTNF